MNQKNDIEQLILCQHGKHKHLLSLTKITAILPSSGKVSPHILHDFILLIFQMCHLKSSHRNHFSLSVVTFRKESILEKGNKLNHDHDLVNHDLVRKIRGKRKKAPAADRTQIGGFKVRSDNHYTTGARVQSGVRTHAAYASRS